MSNLTDPSSFIFALRSYKEVPYKHQGRSRYGLDCLGLILISLKDCGVNATDESPPDYATQFDSQRFIDGVRRRSSLIWSRDLRTPIPQQWNSGTLLIFSFSSKPRHLGIVTCDGQMIHAYQSGQKVVEHTLKGWSHRIFEARWLDFLR